MSQIVDEVEGRAFKIFVGTRVPSDLDRRDDLRAGAITLEIESSRTKNKVDGLTCSSIK